MLRVPKREPKGYILSDITESLMSSAQHTPDSFPRVTQNTLGSSKVHVYPFKTAEIPSFAMLPDAY